MQPVAYAPTASAERRFTQAFDDLTATYSPQEPAFWASGFGSLSEYDGSATTLDHEAHHAGLAIGYESNVSPELVVGALVGYGWGTFESESRWAESFDNAAHGAFASLYGQAQRGDVFATVAMSGGFLSHSDDRLVNDNLAALGVSSAQADYNSWWLSPELTVGWHAGALGDSNWQFTPSARVRYAIQFVDGYTETGPSAANATVASRTVSALESRIQLAATRQFDLAILTVRGGWQYRSTVRTEDANVTLIGQSGSVPVDGEEGSAAFVGGEMSVALGPTLSLDLAGEAAIGDGMTRYGGMATIRATF